MKKIIVTLIIAFVCVSASAQTIRYRASYFSIGPRNDYGQIVWGDWERSNVIITIDFENDFIKVYSEREQNYVIIEEENSYEDNTGGSNVNFSAVDEEGIECTIRLRIQKDGTAQLYAFYSNVAWVYSDLNKL